MSGAVHNLFSKVVYTKILSDRISDDDLMFLQNFADKLDWIKAGNNEDTINNVNNISQSSANNSVLNEKELNFLKCILLDEFSIFKNDILKYQYNDFKITTSWIAKNNPGEQSNYHNHNNSMYSGIFYINTDDNSGAISFEDYSIKRFQLKMSEYNYNNAPEIKFHPQNRLLIFFPSEMYHKILTNNSNIIRYSLAFNLVPTGLLGYDNSDSQWIIQ